jgi:phage terminase large subunit GpA-like protein
MPGCRPLLGRPSKANKQKVPFFPVGTITAKDLIFSRLKITKAGPGYLHLPVWADEEYLAQLTSEKVVTRFTSGRPTRIYQKTRPRNEALDLEVSSLAALAYLGPRIMDNLAGYAERYSPQDPDDGTGDDGVQEGVGLPSDLYPRRESSWVTGWKI